MPLRLDTMDAINALTLLDDASLVRQAQGGDRNAFGALCDRHYRMVFQCAWRRVGNRSDAEDIAQEAFIKLGQGLRTLRDANVFRGWLMRITINATQDLHRKRKSEQVQILAFQREGDVVWYDDASETSSSDASLWRAVAKLPDQQRDAVLLVYADGLSHREAAEALGIAEATISYHVHAARKRLKDIMKEEAP